MLLLPFSRPSLKMGFSNYSYFLSENEFRIVVQTICLHWYLDKQYKRNCCMNSVSYMSLSRAAMSQIETLPPQFTVTAEFKASWWLRDWCSLKYMAHSHKNISSSVQYWIFHGVLVSSHHDTEAETNPFPLALLSHCKSLKFFLFIFKHIKTTKEMYYYLWWGWSH